MFFTWHLLSLVTQTLSISDRAPYCQRVISSSFTISYFFFFPVHQAGKNKWFFLLLFVLKSIPRRGQLSSQLQCCLQITLGLILPPLLISNQHWLFGGRACEITPPDTLVLPGLLLCWALHFLMFFQKSTQRLLGSYSCSQRWESVLDFPLGHYQKRFL